MKSECDFLTDTLIHISEVQEYLEVFCSELRARGIRHDRSKLQEPEFSIFVSTRDQFKKANYGTPEYDAVLDAAQEAVDHHHQNNRHHVAYFPSGIQDMNLLDIIVMICDWKAASRRSPDLSFFDSLPKAFLKYKIPAFLQTIILNTIRDLKWRDHETESK